jgi:hypothetical protein
MNFESLIVVAALNLVGRFFCSKRAEFWDPGAFLNKT